MALLRWATLGALGYGLYRLATDRSPPRRRELDGLSATFATREQADLAVEHLVQEYGIERAFIYVEPLADENSSGVASSGGDHASGGPGHGERGDAPLHGSIQLTVPVNEAKLSVVRNALTEAGATEIEVF